jgi:hypothetical protein
MAAQVPEVQSLIPGRTVEETALIRQLFESVMPGRTEALLALIGPFYDPAFSFQPRPTSLSVEQAALEMPWLAVTDVWSASVSQLSRNYTPTLEVRQNIGTSLTKLVMAERYARVNPRLSEVLRGTLDINLPTLWRAHCALHDLGSRPPGAFRKWLKSFGDKSREARENADLSHSLRQSAQDAWREESLASVIHHVTWWNLWTALLTTTVLVAANDKSYDMRSLLEALRSQQLPLGTDLDNRAVYLNI